MDYFFDKTCNITSITSTYTWWEAIQTTTVIYTWIACDYYNDKWSYSKDWFFVENSETWYVVVLKWDKTNVRRWHIIDLIDWVSIWKFIVDTLLINRNINWIIDNIEMKVLEKRK